MFPNKEQKNENGLGSKENHRTNNHSSKHGMTDRTNFRLKIFELLLQHLLNGCRTKLRSQVRAKRVFFSSFLDFLELVRFVFQTHWTCPTLLRFVKYTANIRTDLLDQIHRSADI